MISSLPIWRVRGGACGESGGGGEQLSSSSKSSARLAKKDLWDTENLLITYNKQNVLITRKN
jgi:hypothetical protein